MNIALLSVTNLELRTPSPQDSSPSDRTDVHCLWVKTMASHLHRFPMTWTNSQTSVRKPLVYFSPCLSMIVSHHDAGSSAWGARKVKTAEKECASRAAQAPVIFIPTALGSGVWACLRVLSRLLINHIKILNTRPSTDGRLVFCWITSICTFPTCFSCCGLK